MGGRPFVRVGAEPPGLTHVVGPNDALIHAAASDDGREVVVTVTIDNLVKGAGGQAVQAMNLALGFPETAGLRVVAPFPIVLNTWSGVKAVKGIWVRSAQASRSVRRSANSAAVAGRPCAPRTRSAYTMRQCTDTPSVAWYASSVRSFALSVHRLAAPSALVFSAATAVDYYGPSPRFCQRGAGCEVVHAWSSGWHLDLVLPALGLVAYTALFALSLVFVTVSSMVVIANNELGATATLWSGVAMVVMWIIFIGDFVIRMRLSGDRRAYMRRNSFELVSVIFPVLRAFLLVLYLWRLPVFRKSPHLQRLRFIVTAASFGLIFVYVASMLVWLVEHQAPRANILHFGDALWWGFATIATAVSYTHLTLPTSDLV